MKVEDTKIYAVLKEVFEDTPEWNEISNNLNKVYLNAVVNDLHFSPDCESLSGAFVWCSSPQGDTYWRDVESKIYDYENNPKQKETMKTKEPELISMDKVYTCNGDEVRILCIDRNDEEYPVVVLINNCQTEHFTKHGEYYSNGSHPEFNLKEYNPWQDVAVDTKICLHSGLGLGVFNRHFAKYEDGKVYYFKGGKTSFTAGEGDIQCWLSERVTLAE